MADFIIKSLSGEDIVADNPETVTGIHRMQGAKIHPVKSDFGKMVFQEYTGEGFTIWYSNYLIDRPVTLVAEGNFSVLELQIPLEDNFESLWDGFGKTQLMKNEFEMSYAPFINNKAILHKSNYRTFDVHYSTGFLQPFATQYSLLERFLENAGRNQPIHLSGLHRFMTPEMKGLIHEMLYHRYTGITADRFYESSATLLLIKMLECISGAEKIKLKITPTDLEKAEQVRRTILSNFEKFEKLTTLAKSVGTNTTKLKTSFKQLTGTTVFKYSQKARLDYVKTLLITTDYNLQTIAEMAGYTEGNNLIEVFRRMTGSTPGYYRKMKK